MMGGTMENTMKATLKCACNNRKHPYQQFHHTVEGSSPLLLRIQEDCPICPACELNEHVVVISIIVES
jgi:hypothetical protein